MDKENNIEMSTVDPHLPKYYKGFDMDILAQKLSDRKPLTNEEKNILSEAQNIYYEKYFEENKKRWENWKKEHPGEYRTYRHPQRKPINGE